MASTTSSDGGTDDYAGLTASGRYVRLTGTQRATQYGYSLYEFEVLGEYTQTAVSLAASSYQLPEKDGTITVPVRLNRAETTPVSVNYATADGTAEAGKDYEAASGTLTFAPGETEKSVTLRALDDAIDEPTETFALNLSDASGATIGPRATATVAIADDDETAFSGRTLSVADFEGDLHVQTSPNADNSGLFTFGNSNPDRPAMTADPTPRPGSVGAQAMKVVSDISAWGGFSNNLAAAAGLERVRRLLVLVQRHRHRPHDAVRDQGRRRRRRARASCGSRTSPTTRRRGSSCACPSPASPAAPTTSRPAARPTATSTSRRCGASR